ncbi:MAG: GNAT family N-acetyltransferase [Oscillospiraceae bacterium]|nr:GNAT family N-acetyltransferase [Oscillospiraceae bacterium]
MMRDFTIREYVSADVPALSLLWRKVFGDSLRLITSFLAQLPQMGSAVVAVREGKVVGAASVVDGFGLLVPGRRPQIVGYIYAVMVDPDSRGLGIGKALTREAAVLGQRRGASLICTLPASDGLYGWYREVLGVECVLRRTRYETAAADRAPVKELTAAEYLLWRNMLLRVRPQLQPMQPAMEFQRQFCKLLGGGLYTCAGGICAAYLDEGVCVIKELICADADREDIAASVGKLLGTERVVYYLPSDTGEPYLAAPPGSVPADCVWNLTFD